MNQQTLTHENKVALIYGQRRGESSKFACVRSAEWGARELERRRLVYPNTKWTIQFIPEQKALDRGLIISSKQ